MSDSTLSTPVVVVGGGPVGLATAVELGHHGIDCVVVEPRADVVSTKPRAKTTSARTMEHLRRWGLADELRRRAPLPVDWCQDIAFCTTATGTEVTRFRGVLGLDLAGSDTAAEPGQQVAQPVVEQTLRDALSRSPHVRLLFGHRAVAFDQQPDGVRCTLAGPDGDELVVDAQYVVGADGARSVVRAAMGARYEGQNAGRPNLSVVFRSPGLAEHLVGEPALHYWVLDPRSPGVLGPMDRADTWWAIATGRPDDGGDADPIAIVQGIIGREVPIEVLGTDPWQARALLVDSYRDGRLFLVGDAAHQNPPWGGHGFNTGIGDAVNLGWKLAAVLQGWAPADLLDSYETERRPVAADTIGIASTNTAALPTDLAAADDDPDALRALADRIQAAKALEFHCLGLVLGYGYGPGAGTQTTNGADFVPAAVPGNRLPHRWLAPGLSLYDELGSDLTVVGDPAGAQPLVEAAAQRGVPLTVLPDAGDELVLVRPDQHIAWIGGPLTEESAVAVLDAALTGFTARQPVPAH